MRRGTYAIATAALLLLALPFWGQESEHQGASQEAAQAKIMKMQSAQYMNFPGLPTCASGAVYDGNPGTGPSLLFIKTAKGCKVPWHWHTPSEFVMMQSGTANVEMKNGGPGGTIGKGDYVAFPSKHQHQFTCTTECAFFLYSDAKFDIHYVDAGGNEISPEQALKAVNETATPAPKQ